MQSCFKFGPVVQMSFKTTDSGQRPITIAHLEPLAHQGQFKLINETHFVLPYMRGGHFG